MLKGEKAIVNVTSPASFLGKAYYYFNIDNVQSSFAIVNKNNYIPSVKVNDRKKKWFNYINDTPRITIYDSFHGTVIEQTSRPLGSNIDNDVDIENCAIILEPLKQAVHFFKDASLVATLGLPSSPIISKKHLFTSANEEGGLTGPKFTGTVVYVLCTDGIVYRIHPNLKYDKTIPFVPVVLPPFFLNNLAIAEAIPFKGDFTDASRLKLTAALFPKVVCLEVTGNSIWVAGVNIFWIVGTRTLTVQKTFSYGIDVAAMARAGTNSVVVTSKLHRIVWMTVSGVILDITPPGTTVVGSPGYWYSRTVPRAVVPDASNNRIIIVAGSTGATSIVPLGDFVPAYANSGDEFDTNIYITGYDNNKLIIFDVFGNRKDVNFPSKITFANICNTYVYINHYLENYTTLDLSNIEKIIPFTVANKGGPTSHISSDPVQVKMLGRQTITAYAPNLTHWWVNGVYRNTMNTDDYVGIVYRASDQGFTQTQLVIGEDAIDFKMEVKSDTSIMDFVNIGVLGINKIGGVYNYVLPENVLGAYPLGFDVTFWGYSYSDIIVTNNGVLGFDPTYPYSGVVPGIGTVMNNAILPRPEYLYPDYPIDNRDPLAIVDGTYTTADIPGVYWTSGTIGEFAYFKLKYIGTPESLFPKGLVKKTEAIAQTGTEINFVDFTNILIDDYISNPITDPAPYVTFTSTGPVTGPTQVVALTPYADTDVAYWSEPGQLAFYVSAAKVIKTYSKVTSAGGTKTHGFYNYQINEAVAGNPLVSITLGGLFVTVANEIVAPVDKRWVFDFTRAGFPTQTYLSVVNIQNNMTSMPIYKASTGTDIMIGFSSPTSVVGIGNYNLIIPGQSLFCTDFSGTGFDTVTGKIAIVRTYRLTLSFDTMEEGQTIKARLRTTNVVNGTMLPFEIVTSGLGTVDINDFDPNFTVVYPFGGAPTFNIPKTLIGTLPVYNDCVELQMTYATNVDASNLEGYYFRMDLSSVYANRVLSGFVKILDLGAGSSSSLIVADPPTTSLAVTEYYIRVTGPQTVYTTSLLQVKTTRVNLTSIPAWFTPVTTRVDYRRHRHILYNFANPTYATLTLNFTGNFIQFTNSQTLPSGTDVLFKTYQPHPTAIYEIGIFSGKNYQFLEMHYDINHNYALVEGVRGYATSTAVTPPITAPTTAILGSTIQKGAWSFLGFGSFIPTPTGYKPRNLRYYLQPSMLPNEIRYDIFVDLIIPATSDIRASLEYGWLYRNKGPYFGKTKISQDDVLTVQVPMGPNQAPSAVIFSLGSAQIALPIYPYANKASYTITDVLVGNQVKETSISTVVTIPASNTYWVPNYYRSAAGTGASEIQFFWIPAGATPIQIYRGTYNFLGGGDSLQVSNVFTGYRDYNVYEIIIVSTSILRIRVQTANPPVLIDPINFPILLDPFVRLTTDETLQLPTGLDTSGRIGFPTGTQPAYSTASLPVTAATTGVTVDLMADMPGVTFIKNGDIEYDNNNTFAVSGVDTLGLEWDVKNYYQEDAVIYQIALDPLDGSPIYVNVGSWPIQQKQMTARFINRRPEQGRAVSQITLINPGLGYVRGSVSITFDPPSNPFGRPPVAYLDVNSINGSISQIVLIDGGDGYTTPPSITFVGASTLSAVATATLSSDVISTENSINVSIKPQMHKLGLLANTMPKAQLVNSVSLFNAPKLAQSLAKNYTFVFGSLGQILPKSQTNMFGKQNYLWAGSATPIFGKISYSPKPFSFSVVYGYKIPSFIGKAPTILRRPLIANRRTLRPPTFFTGKIEYKFGPNGTFLNDILTYRFLGAVTYFTGKQEYRRYLPSSYFTGRVDSRTDRAATIFRSINRPRFGRPATFAGYGLSPRHLLNQYYVMVPKRDFFVEMNKSGFVGSLINDKKTTGISFVPGSKLLSELVKSITPNKFFVPNGLIMSPTLGFSELEYGLIYGPTLDSEIINYKTFTSQTYIDKALTAQHESGTLVSNPLFQGTILQNSAQYFTDILNYLKSFQATDSNHVINYGLDSIKDNIIMPINYQLDPITITTSKTRPELIKQFIFGKDFKEQYITTDIYGISLKEKYFVPNYVFKSITEKLYKDNPLFKSFREEYAQQMISYVDFVEKWYKQHLIFRTLREEKYQNKEIYKSLREEKYQPPQIRMPFTEKFYRPFTFLPPFLPQVYRPLEFYPPITPQKYMPDEIKPRMDPEVYRPYYALPPFLPEVYRPYYALPPFLPEVYRPCKALPPFTPETYRPTTVLPPFLPLIYRPFIVNPRLRPQLYRPNMPRPPFRPEVYRPYTALPPFLPEIYRPYKALPPFLPEIYRPYEALPDFVPEIYRPFFGLPELPPEIYRPYFALPELPPEIYRPFEAYPDLIPEIYRPYYALPPWLPKVIQEHLVFVKMNFELFQEIYHSQDDELATGAFRASFRIYANEGRESDYGQYQGVVPGLPNRPDGPWLPYESNKGSSLLLKSPVFGTGGFYSETDAAFVAAKYVSAGAIQIKGTDYWNYRIFFDTGKVCSPKKSMIFPRIWYIRGG